ncbi:hypothetical protein ZHAS_00018929 [Anopheles sinensis]|uniref:Uncharacterized protein n=1 Tax=Anopheles sinensis TaxID=74873 RepID=A0A084WK65_ANOSI|nr:hypothetical protein ZHAS_00018929 [Anopheles sinensis]
MVTSVCRAKTDLTLPLNLSRLAITGFSYSRKVKNLAGRPAYRRLPFTILHDRALETSSRGPAAPIHAGFRRDDASNGCTCACRIKLDVAFFG